MSAISSVVFGPLRIARLPGILLQVEEVGPALRRVLQLVAVIAQHEAVDEAPTPQVLTVGGDIDVLAADLAPSSFTKRPSSQPSASSSDLHLDHIPVQIAALHLGAQDADAAVQNSSFIGTPAAFLNGSK